MKLLWIPTALILIALTGQAQTARIGTFDQQSLVVAYYRSPQWAEIMNAKLAERDAAKKANDAAKLKELETWGQSHQDLAHHQLAGEAPITNILEALKVAWPDIAKRAGVSLIDPNPIYADPSVQKVDLTGPLLDYLKADARTRILIGDLKKH